MAGVVGLVVDIAVLYVLAPVLGWYVARAGSFLVAASATWWLNRRFTFARLPLHSRQPVWLEYVQYLASMLVGGSVNYLVYASVVYGVHSVFAPVLGVALGSIAGLIFNYLAARHFVFRR
ncbi:MAG: GtrA family protein [Simplicispira sp.]|nr:GtrA family protein [Simplicispira sp.]